MYTNMNSDNVLPSQVGGLPVHDPTVVGPPLPQDRVMSPPVSPSPVSHT